MAEAKRMQGPQETLEICWAHKTPCRRLKMRCVGLTDKVANGVQADKSEEPCIAPHLIGPTNQN